MLQRNLYVSATDAVGGFAERGMADLARALKVFERYVEADAGGEAAFALLSDHDGRLHVKRAGEGFDVRVVARNARAAMLGGLLPAREAMVWEVAGVDVEQVRGLITALFKLPASEFRLQVKRELAG